MKICKHENIIARTDCTIFFLKTFEDGSSALCYDNGYTVGIWCRVDNLRRHLLHLQNVKHGKNWSSLIPEDWIIYDHEFFKRLGIE